MFDLHKTKTVSSGKFSNFGKLLSLNLSMVPFFPSHFEVFTNVYVIYVDSWAYGILLWEIFKIGG